MKSEQYKSTTISYPKRNEQTSYYFPLQIYFITFITLMGDVRFLNATMFHSHYFQEIANRKPAATKS
jgi:archaellum component FlaF (FlaF/FlaG flagellin family)